MKFNGLIFELETMERVKFDSGETEYITDIKQFLIFRSTDFDRIKNLVKVLIQQVMQDGKKDDFTVYLYGLDSQFRKVEYVKFTGKKLERKYSKMHINNEKGLYEEIESCDIDNIDIEILNTIHKIREKELM